MLIAAVTTCAWAVVVSIAPLLVVSLAVWAADGRSTISAAAVTRFAADVWLLAHGVPLSFPGGHISLIPLLLSAVVCWQIVRAGANTARAAGTRRVATSVHVVVAIAVLYGVTGAAVASFARSDLLSADTALAGLVTALVAAICAGVGVLRENELAAVLWMRLPLVVRRAARGAGIAVLGIVAGAALLAGAALAFSTERARGMFDAYSPGIVGGFGLFLLSLFFLPSMIVWTIAYVVGPGFTIGVGTSVTSYDVSTGPMPAFPLLAAVPTHHANLVTELTMMMPVLAGVAAGLAVARHMITESTVHILLAAPLVGPMAGACLAAACWLSSGAFGGERFTTLGPRWWQVGLFFAAEVALASLAGAAIQRWVIPGVSRWRRERVKPAAL